VAGPPFIAMATPSASATSTRSRRPRGSFR